MLTGKDRNKRQMEEEERDREKWDDRRQKKCAWGKERKGRLLTDRTEK